MRRGNRGALAGAQGNDRAQDCRGQEAVAGRRPLPGGGEDPGGVGADAVPLCAGDQTADTGDLNANLAILRKMSEWYPFFALAGLIIGLFVWLRSDIQKLDERLGKRIDTLGDRIDKLAERANGLVADVAALKATVETFFRVSIDPPPPDPERHDQAA